MRWTVAYASRLNTRRVSCTVTALEGIALSGRALIGNRFSVEDRRFVRPIRGMTQQAKINYQNLTDMPLFAPGTPRYPPTLRRWKATMQDYYNRMHAMGIRASGLLSTGLGLDPSFFEGCFSESMSALRLLHYSSEV